MKYFVLHRKVMLDSPPQIHMYICDERGLLGSNTLRLSDIGAQGTFENLVSFCLVQAFRTVQISRHTRHIHSPAINHHQLFVCRHEADKGVSTAPAKLSQVQVNRLVVLSYAYTSLQLLEAVSMSQGARVGINMNMN